MAISNASRAKTAFALLFGFGASLIGQAAKAQDAVADFYRGKTVHLVVGSAVGAAYDFAGRAVGAHLGRYIPGNPTIVIENIPGAAGITMMNQLYNRSARDGTVFGLPLNGVVLEPRLKALSRDGSNVLFDLSKMSWIGTPAQQPQSIIVWHETPYRSLLDLRDREVVFGTTSPGTDSNVMPVLANALIGTKIKVISGYQGVSDVFHAIEQGELQGASVLLSSFFGKPDWVREKKARLLVQFGTDRIKGIEDVPTAIELAPNDEARLMLRVYATKFKATYPFVLPPGVPQERVIALRAAFDAAMKDPALIADAKKLGIDIDPLGGEAIGKMMGDIDAVPQDIIDRLRKVIEP